MFSRACPATIFANSRIPRLNARETYDTISITTSRGTRAVGVPAGRKNVANFHPCFATARIVTPRKIVTDSPIQTITELVIAKLYGTFPNRLPNSTKKNIE